MDFLDFLNDVNKLLGSIAGSPLNTETKHRKRRYDPADFSLWETPDFLMYNPECPNCRNSLRYSEKHRMFYCEHCDCYYVESLFEDSEDDIPDGCAACGGPWPDCQSSCNMYDD